MSERSQRAAEGDHEVMVGRSDWFALAKLTLFELGIRTSNYEIIQLRVLKWKKSLAFDQGNF